MKSYIRRTASVIALGLVAGGTGVAFAQETPAATSAAPETIQPGPAEDDTAVADKVVITGSRLASGADAPTPVTAVTTDAINAVALPNVADALVQLPALKQSVTSAKGGQGLTIGSQLNLRNIGSFRTLVLVDGKRFVTTAPFGAGRRGLTGRFAVLVDGDELGIDLLADDALFDLAQDLLARDLDFIDCRQRGRVGRAGRRLA